VVGAGDVVAQDGAGGVGAGDQDVSFAIAGVVARENEGAGRGGGEEPGVVEVDVAAEGKAAGATREKNLLIEAAAGEAEVCADDLIAGALLGEDHLIAG
jgi:hypothetical protein